MGLGDPARVRSGQARAWGGTLVDQAGEPKHHAGLLVENPTHRPDLVAMTQGGGENYGK